METINNIELRDENIYPDEKVLEKILGESYDAYCSLLNLYGENNLSHEWRYYRDGKAWLCKVQKKKKTIVWMSAWKGYMQATVYFQEKYMQGIYSLGLGNDALERIRKAKNVGKSWPCIFEVRDKAVLDDFNKVMQYKISVV